MTDKRYAEIAKTKKMCEFCPDLGEDKTCIACQRAKPITLQELRAFWDRVCAQQAASEAPPAPQTNFEHIRKQTETPHAMAVHMRMQELRGTQDNFCRGSAQCDAILDANEYIPEEMCTACLERWLDEPRLPVEEAYT